METLKNLKNFERFSKHIKYLKSKTSNNTVFLVWWSLRDMILWIENEPHDIDVTMPWNPNDIFNKINKEYISIFRTEKFWTISIIPKECEISKIWYRWESTLQYEITPFREEWQYWDFRHPENISRTNSLYEDSKRRDFTINCLYYTYIEWNYQCWNEIITIWKENKFLEIISDEKNIYLPSSNLLVIKSIDTIKNLHFNNFEQDINSILNKSINIVFNWEEKETNINYLNIIIDPSNWFHDIITKIIKTVWDPDSRFWEDALRIIRAVRLTNILNQKLKNKEEEWKQLFDFEPETRRSMKKNFYLVRFLAKERIRDEVVKVFKWKNPFWFVALIDELNLLQYIFPSVQKCKNKDQPVRYHPFDIYNHTILCLRHLQKINNSYLVKLWILYHDIWKVEQYYYVSLWISPEERKKYQWAYIHHPNIWADLAYEELIKLWYSKKEAEEVRFYTKYHMLPWELLNAQPDNLPKKIKKLISERWHEKIQNLFDISIADRQWQFNPMQDSDIKWIYKLKDLANNIFEQEWQFKKSDLKINWNDIMEQVGIEPWPIVWKIIDCIFERVLEDPNDRNNKKVIRLYIKDNIKTENL